MVVTIFALLQKDDLRDRAIRLLGSHDLQRSTLALDDAGYRLSRYFLTQLGLNTSFGVIVGAGLYLIGVPHPVLWGILGALLRFIPYIGSWIAALIARRARGGGAAGLGDGDGDDSALRRGRADHGPDGRAARLRPLHRPLAAGGRHRRDLLDLGMGADRVDHFDPADAVPGRARDGTSRTSNSSTWCSATVRS